MQEPKRYPIPSQTARVEDTIDRSRFITTLGPAATIEEARAFVAEVREEFPDATHNCWAYVVGQPGDSSRGGMSDDGEPHGTAGRPMLAVLLGSGVGDIAAVVTRYYGGRKLGKGGLVRAYSGGVKRALEVLVRSEFVRRLKLDVAADYSAETLIRAHLPDFEAEIVSARYGAEISLSVRLPEDRVDAFITALSGLTGGRARVVRA
jgi:uncharacterized YigZ family protein